VELSLSDLDMGMRTLAVGLLLLLSSGCCYGYFVGRPSFDLGSVEPRLLRRAIESHELMPQVADRSDSRFVVYLQRGDAMAVMSCVVAPESVVAHIHSEWWGRLPDYALLCASLELQEEFLRSLSPVAPLMAAALASDLVWSGFEAPLGPEFAALKDRYEAEHPR
jgi:hypothetical protein